MSRRQGRGTFVTGNGVDGPLSGIFQHNNPLEVIEVRLTVEPTIARLASLRALRSDIERLYKLLEAARYAIFLALYDSLQVLQQDATWERLGENGRCYKRQAVYAKDHREIIEAIAARDSARRRQCTGTATTCSAS